MYTILEQIIRMQYGMQDLHSRRNESGATAVEYGLLVGLIAAAIIAAVTLLGGNVSKLFTNIANKIPTT